MQYHKATDNYRRTAQHRHPRNVDFGQPANLIRSYPPRCPVSYAAWLPRLVAPDDNATRRVTYGAFGARRAQRMLHSRSRGFGTDRSNGPRIGAAGSSAPSFCRNLPDRANTARYCHQPNSRPFSKVQFVFVRRGAPGRTDFSSPFSGCGSHSRDGGIATGTSLDASASVCRFQPFEVSAFADELQYRWAS